MEAADLLTAASFWDDHGDEVTAGATLVLALVVAKLVDGAIARRGTRLTAAVVGGELSPVADTRLRLVRRLTFALILVIGVALALSQFQDVKRLATGILASSAVLGLVVGFAARQTLANAIAGILLAITQPIRIGDVVTFEENTGTVEDVRLTYTFIRADDGTRIVIPNERLAQSTIQNHTIVDERVHVEVSVWIPAYADVSRAVQVLSEEPEVDVEVADAEKDAIRLSVGTWADNPAQGGALAARIRARSLERLQAEGLSSKASS
jgi:small-conductance mechanosensitive channel